MDSGTILSLRYWNDIAIGITDCVCLEFRGVGWFCRMAGPKQFGGL